MPVTPMLVGAVALVFAIPAPEATIRGAVRDAATGEPLPGAVVALTDLDRTAVAGPDGRYELAAVPPGPQHLVVRRLGYRSRTLHLLVPPGGGLRVDVSLQPAPLELEGLVVASSRPIRGLDAGDSTAFPDRGLTMAALMNHPTLAQPDAFRALAGGEVVLDPEAAVGVHVRGGGADHTAYLLDGVPLLNPYHAAGLFSALNPDALARIRLAAAPGSPALPDALSGAITATTRDPGDRLRVRTAMSNTEARLTVDGPAGPAGAGYVIGWRSGFPGPLAPSEASYLSGESGDLLAKIQAPAFGGRGRILVYDSENEIAAARDIGEGRDPGAEGPQNRFEWDTRSIGLGWTWVAPGGPGGSGTRDRTVRLTAWRAATGAGSDWGAAIGPVAMTSRRVDHGIQGVVGSRSGRTEGEAGIRLRHVETAYEVDTEAGPAPDAAGSVAGATVFAWGSTALGPAILVGGGGSASLAGGSARLAPRVRIRWRPIASLDWTLAFSRTHQLAQSLRNPESVVGHVFPADLFLAAGVAGVPIPRSDQLVAAASWTPLAGIRLGGQAFVRAMEDLVLVGPGESEPFSMGSFTPGAAVARGVSVDLAASGARYGVVAGYGWQRTRIRHDDAEYAPRHGTAHTIDAGVIVFPSATASLRLAVTAAAGRAAAPVAGPFEWEACNLLDRGCEFAGSPRLGGAPGETELPAYVRLDLGGRKHWHLRLGGRDVLIGAFASLTNVLGRRNILTWLIDPGTGDREPVEMLPRAPLVLGIDSRF